MTWVLIVAMLGASGGVTVKHLKGFNSAQACEVMAKKVVALAKQSNKHADYACVEGAKGDKR